MKGAGMKRVRGIKHKETVTSYGLRVTGQFDFWICADINKRELRVDHTSLTSGSELKARSWFFSTSS